MSPESNPDLGSERDRYFAKRPSPYPFSWERLKSGVRFYIAVFIERIRHTYAIYETEPVAPTGIGNIVISDVQPQDLEVCRFIYDSVERRQETLEQKGTVLVSTIAILAPLLISGVAYVAQYDRLSGFTKSAVMAIGLISTFFLLTSLIAALKVNSVRGRQALYLQSLVDFAEHRVRLREHQYLRLLMYNIAVNSAINDHVADFVRSSQHFLAIAAILASL